MTDSPSGAEIGCRSGFLAGMALLGWALAIGAVGLTMVLSDRCTGPCDGIGLSLFYAAAPISALFGVLGGGIPVAWPLDIGLWILAGIGAASWAGRLIAPCGASSSAWASAPWSTGSSWRGSWPSSRVEPALAGTRRGGLGAGADGREGGWRLLPGQWTKRSRSPSEKGPTAPRARCPPMT